MRMRSIIAQVARRLNNRAAVGEDRGTEIHPIYMQAEPESTAVLAKSEAPPAHCRPPLHTGLRAVNTGGSGRPVF